MAALTARLHEGRFVLDDPGGGDAPRLTLVIEDDEDELDVADRARLEAFIEVSAAASARGETVSGEELMAGIRARRRG